MKIIETLAYKKAMLVDYNTDPAKDGPSSTNAYGPPSLFDTKLKNRRKKKKMRRYDLSSKRRERSHIYHPAEESRQV